MLEQCQSELCAPTSGFVCVRGLNQPVNNLLAVKIIKSTIVTQSSRVRNKSMNIADTMWCKLWITCELFTVYRDSLSSFSFSLFSLNLSLVNPMWTFSLFQKLPCPPPSPLKSFHDSVPTRNRRALYEHIWLCFQTRSCLAVARGILGILERMHILRLKGKKETGQEK